VQAVIDRNCLVCVVAVHIAHDCTIGGDVVVVLTASIEGVHQFCEIGKSTMIIVGLYGHCSLCNGSERQGDSCIF
jgi:acyl-[acyl carrier protein]--UDP-N-acetylglucosamine O-acyltransferase